jgi:hypothetical protein
MIGPFIDEDHLESDIYVHFLQNKLLNLWEDALLETQVHIHFHHDGVPTNFNCVVKMCRSHWLLGRWFISEGLQD